MLEKTIISILVLCYGIATYSQPKITVGKPYKFTNGQEKFYFYKDNELLTVKKDDERLYVQKFNTDSLYCMVRNLFPVHELGFEGIKKINSRYFMFYSSNRGLFIREIDFNSGSFKDEGKKIISAERVVSSSFSFDFGIPEKMMVHRYNIYVSNNDSIVAIQYGFKPENRDDSKNYETIGLHIFDSNFQELSSNNLKMPYTEDRVDNLAYSVDSKGNAYIVTRVYEDDTTIGKTVNSDESNYHLEILKIVPQAVNFTTTQVNLEGNFIKTVRLFEDPKGSMTCIGFYNRGKKPNNVDGIIQFKLNTDNSLYDFKTYEIPLEILNHYVSERTKVENNNNEMLRMAEIENLALREIVFSKDGSMLIISEQVEKKVHATFSGGSGTGINGAGTPSGASFSKSTTYADKDMLVAKIDSVGKMSWMKKLPKGHISGSEVKTFYYLPGNGEHHLLFLDKMKNFDLKVNERHSTIHGTADILMAYSINDKTGKVEKTAILDLRNVEAMPLHHFAINRIETISPSVFVFEAYKKNGEDVLIKVDLSN